ncbi:MAG: hypothetical protein QXH17_04720 [Candidatus Bathyarchaeia archaeon]
MRLSELLGKTTPSWVSLLKASSWTVEASEYPHIVATLTIKIPFV